jgi:hypothetical protein
MRYSIRTLLVWLLICSPLLLVLAFLAPLLTGFVRVAWMYVGVWPFALLAAIIAILISLGIVCRYPRTKPESRAE